MQDWKINPDVSQYTLYQLLECTMSIGHSLSSMSAAGHATSLPHLITAARGVSVDLRKILLDDKGRLLHGSISEPLIHPMKLLPDIRPATFIRQFPSASFHIETEGGRTSDITVPAHAHTTIVHPLPGISHNGDATFEISTPFDLAAKPVKVSHWLNQKVLRVDQHRFNAGEAIRLLANREGAHASDDISFITPVRFDSSPAVRFGTATSVRFGGLSYLHLFALFTGFYLVSRIKPLLNHLPFPTENSALQAIRESISAAPSVLHTDRAQIQIVSGGMLVLDEDLQLRGDYDAGVTTTIGRD